MGFDCDRTSPAVTTDSLITPHHARVLLRRYRRSSLKKHIASFDSRMEVFRSLEMRAESLSFHPGCLCSLLHPSSRLWSCNFTDPACTYVEASARPNIEIGLSGQSKHYHRDTNFFGPCYDAVQSHPVRGGQGSLRLYLHCNHSPNKP